jgi:thymidine kinase
MKLYFKYGSMGSCKSLLLLTTAFNLDEKGIKFVILKPSIDTRETSSVVKSRVGVERECILVDTTTNLYTATEEYVEFLKNNGDHKLSWVLVDECQFLTEEQVDQLSDVVDYMNVNVMCYGLKTDFQTKLFPASKRLFELADDIEELKASCECSKKTMINARFDMFGNIVTEGAQILVGGNDVYHPLCRKCYKEKINNKNKE